MVPVLLMVRLDVTDFVTMSAQGVRRGKAAFFSGCKSHPATIAPAGSNRSSHGGNEVAEASGEPKPDKPDHYVEIDYTRDGKAPPRLTDPDSSAPPPMAPGAA